MADSVAVDAAQSAGFTVAATTGKVTGPISAAQLHRLMRVVEGAGGRVEFTDSGVKASKVLYSGVAGKEIKLEALTVGTAGNSITLAIVVAGGSVARTITAAGSDITVNVATTAGAVNATETAAAIVAAINADADSNALVLASLGDSAGAKSAKAVATLTDITAEGGSDALIFTGKTNGEGFSVDLRGPRGKSEAALTSVTVSMEAANNRIIIVCPAGKTIANVKTAVEAHVAANAVVAVTTAGTTSHVVVPAYGVTSDQGSFANRGEVVVTALAAQQLAGGTASDLAVRVQPAVA